MQEKLKEKLEMKISPAFANYLKNLTNEQRQKLVDYGNAIAAVFREIYENASKESSK